MMLRSTTPRPSPRRSGPGASTVDYLRNARGATAVSAYSDTGRAAQAGYHAADVGRTRQRLSGSQFTIGNFSNRLQRLSDDPWSEFFHLRQRPATKLRAIMLELAVRRRVAVPKEPRMTNHDTRYHSALRNIR